MSFVIVLLALLMFVAYRGLSVNQVFARMRAGDIEGRIVLDFHD